MMTGYWGGIRVFQSEYCEVQELVLPLDRFIEYGPEDEWWLVKYGYADYQTRPAAYWLGTNRDAILIHPKLLAELNLRSIVVN